MQMEAGLDTGPMLLTRQVEIAGKTAGVLADDLALVGAELMVEALTEPLPDPAPQDDSEATYAAKIDKAEAALDFSRSAEQVDRQVRAFNPAPGAWFAVGGERLKVLEVAVEPGVTAAPGTVLANGTTIACGTGAVRLRLVQRPGKRAMTMADLLNGFAMPERIDPCPASS
jgi:methionyl-tRNA formyltransferase